METMLEEKLPQRAEELGAYIVSTLTNKLAGNPLVKEVRGLGMLIGIVCTQPTAELIAIMQEQAVLVVSAGPNVIRLAPSLVIAKEDVDRGLEVICDVLSKQAAAAVQQ
jgi:acetylornithine aminotransferase